MAGLLGDVEEVGRWNHSFLRSDIRWKSAADTSHISVGLDANTTSAATISAITVLLPLLHPPLVLPSPPPSLLHLSRRRSTSTAATLATTAAATAVRFSCRCCTSYDPLLSSRSCDLHLQVQDNASRSGTDRIRWDAIRGLVCEVQTSLRDSVMSLCCREKGTPNTQFWHTLTCST